MRTYVNQCTSAQVALHSNLLLSILWVPWLPFLEKGTVLPIPMPRSTSRRHKICSIIFTMVSLAEVYTEPQLLETLQNYLLRVVCRHWKNDWRSHSIFCLHICPGPNNWDKSWDTDNLVLELCMGIVCSLRFRPNQHHSALVLRWPFFLVRSSSPLSSDRTPTHEHIEHFPNWLESVFECKWYMNWYVFLDCCLTGTSRSTKRRLRSMNDSVFMWTRWADVDMWNVTKSDLTNVLL